MRSTTAFLAMLLIIGQIASACHGPLISPTGQPTTCDELSEADLVGESMGVMSDEEAQRWIFERYGVQASVGADYGSHHSLYWRTDGKYYSMLLGEDRTSLGMVWETGFPTVQQVLDLALGAMGVDLGQRLRSGLPVYAVSDWIRSTLMR